MGQGGSAPRHYRLVPPLRTPGRHRSPSSEGETRSRDIAKAKGVVCHQRLWCAWLWTETGDGCRGTGQGAELDPVLELQPEGLQVGLAPSLPPSTLPCLQAALNFTLLLFANSTLAPWPCKCLELSPARLQNPLFPASRTTSSTSHHAQVQDCYVPALVQTSTCLESKWLRQSSRGKD